jgi:osmotically-inducible protein OsmY
MERDRSMAVHRPEIEREIESRAGVDVVVEQDGKDIVLTGMVSTEGERQAALDIALSLIEPQLQLVDNIEVAAGVPEFIEGMEVAVEDAGDLPGAMPNTADDEALEPGDFTDQAILENPLNAAGPTGIAIDEDISEGDEAYVPPIDPVRDAAGEVLGGYSLDSMRDDETVDRSEVVGGSPDEAIRDAVLRELREDAGTTALEIEVEVFEGRVELRGTVDDMLDVEAAEEVAARIPGVVEVTERLRVRNG